MAREVPEDVAIPLDDGIDDLGDHHVRADWKRIQRRSQGVAEPQAADEHAGSRRDHGSPAREACQLLLGPVRARRHQLASIHSDLELCPAFPQNELRSIRRECTSALQPLRNRVRDHDRE